MPRHENSPKVVNYIRPELEEVTPDLDLIDDLLEGTRRMHAQSKTYIKKWPNEADDVYNFRRIRENLFEGLGRTLSAATGMLFAKPPAIEWNQSETAMTEQLQNVDAAGTAWPVFVKRYAELAIKDGLAVIVVDHPRAPEGVVVTAANEKELGLRPRWAMYQRAQAINWYDDVVNNKRTLTRIILNESAIVPADEYGVTSVNRFRDIRLTLTPDGYQATWTLKEQIHEDGNLPEHFKTVGSGVFRNRAGKIADFLPVAVGYAGRTDAIMTARPPLLGVAYSNLGHWQISTDLRFNSEVVGFSQLVVKGELAKDANGIAHPLQIGPLTAIQVEKEGDALWAGPAPEGLNQLEKRKNEKLTEMAQQGLSFLQTDTRAAETATAKALDASAENSTLATAAQAIEDSVNAALAFHGWFLGIEDASCPVITISRDYDNTAMDAALIGAYVQLVNAGFPKRTVAQALQAGGRIPADTDLDELIDEWDAGHAAAEAQREIEAQERLRLAAAA